MNREERRKQNKGQKNKKKYFECPQCKFKHKVLNVLDNEMYLGNIICDCGIKAFIVIQNGYVVSIDKVWK